VREAESAVKREERRGGPVLLANVEEERTPEAPLCRNKAPPDFVQVFSENVQFWTNNFEAKI
jgi:hypothetical protein